MSWNFYDHVMNVITYDILKPLAFVVFFVILAAYVIVGWHRHVTPLLTELRRHRRYSRGRKVAL